MFENEKAHDHQQFATPKKGEEKENTAEAMSKAETAIFWAQLGGKVFPLRPGGKEPLTPNGIKEATNNIEIIAKWWSDCPDANIGLACGNAAGFVAIGVHDSDYASGTRTLQGMEHAHGPFDTATFTTSGGGKCLCFSTLNKDLPSAESIFPGIDLHSDGSFVVLPPSEIDGNKLYWLKNVQPQEIPRKMFFQLRNLAKSMNKEKNENPEVPLEIAKPLQEEVNKIAANPLPEVRENKKTVEEPIPPLLPLTELGNAERLVRRHGKEIRFVPEQKKWIVWNRTTWEADDDGIFRRAKETVRAITEEIRGNMGPGEMEAIRRHAHHSESRAQLTAMIDLAKHEPGVVVHQEELDTDDMLLGVKNGVVDLRTGQHRPAKPEDLLTKQAGVAYDVAAKCPHWLAFLATIFAGSETMQEYIRRKTGYLLTGNVSERVMFILFGNGSNGKSTFLEVLRALLFGYSLQALAEMFMATKRASRGVPNDIARLAGARFVSASETEEGAPLAESAVKYLTGGDTVTARFLFSEFFEFRPTCKFLIATNYRPEVRGDDPAIWNRLHLIPFAVTIPKEQQDRHLRDKLLAELPGILNWAIQGCLEWQRDGLQPPPEVQSATDDYRSDQNLVAMWLDEQCTREKGARSQASFIYKSYKNWVEKQSEKPLTQRMFGERLKTLGFERIKSDTYFYIGLRLTVGRSFGRKKSRTSSDLDDE